MTNWDEIAEIEVPRGSFIGWGDRAGQHVTGKVLSYSENGGTNFANEPCPQISVELTEQAASFNKAGERTDFPAGELVTINAGLANLLRAVRTAALNPGDLVKITLADFEKTANGTVKIFSIKVARGAGGPVTPRQAPAAAPAAPPAADPWATKPVQDEPPF